MPSSNDDLGSYFNRVRHHAAQPSFPSLPLPCGTWLVYIIKAALQTSTSPARYSARSPTCGINCLLTSSRWPLWPLPLPLTISQKGQCHCMIVLCTNANRHHLASSRRTFSSGEPFIPPSSSTNTSTYMADNSPSRTVRATHPTDTVGCAPQ